MASNFNDTTPAAPAGGVNVLWQTDGGGNDSAYIPAGSFALPAVAVIDLTAQTTNIAPTLLYAAPASGMYRVSVFAIVTQAATTSSVLPNVNILFTDVDNSTPQTLLATVTNPGNVLTTYEQAVQVVYAKTGTNLQYSTTNFASVGGTAMLYALHIRVEAI